VYRRERQHRVASDGEAARIPMALVLDLEKSA
jgi:hypothetical protein